MNASSARAPVSDDHSRKSILALATAILLAAVLGWLSFSAREAEVAREDARQGEVRTLSVLLASGKVLRAMQDAETGQRGYLLTRDPAYLRPLEDGRERIPAALAQLRSLFGQDTREAARIDRIEDLAGRRLRMLDRSISMERPPVATDAVLLTSLRGGRQSMAELRAELDALQEGEQAVLGQRQELARRTGALAGQWRMLLTGFSLVLCLLFGLALLGMYRARREEREQRLLAESNMVLAHGRKLLQSIIDSSVDAIFVKDRRGRVMFANQRFREIVPTPLAQLTGIPLLPASDPEEAAALAAAASAVIERGQQQTVEEHIEVGGERRLFQTHKIPWLTEKGIAGVIGVARDITDFRARESELERRVAVRTVELEDALHTLQREMAERVAAEETVRQMQRIESLGQLTGGIAHDFNNMLAVITGSLDAARRKLSGEAREAVGPLIDNALEGAARAAALTARLLAFARQQSLRPCHVEINAQVEKTCELLQRTLSGNIKVRLDLDPLAGWTEVDATQLESALVNLAVNARDAMPDGGTITIATRREGGEVRIDVVDTGTGMSADQLAHAFEPFFTTKEVGKGTGLGLSQVHGFVTQSGGRVELHSRPGQGTTVTLRLPVCEASSDSSAAAAPEPALAASGEVVLLVEDEVLVRHALKVALEELGFAVLAAGSSQEALAQLHSGREVALLITDIAMPGMNGRELADAARALRPDLPVLLTTGYEPSPPDRADLPVLVKPYLVDELAAAIRALLPGRDGAEGNKPHGGHFGTHGTAGSETAA